MRMSRKDETVMTRLRQGRCTHYLHVMKCHEIPSRWNLRHLRYTRNDPPPVDGMPTLHLRLNEGNLQKTKEPHQILSSEQSMKIIMDYVRENEELARRIWPSEFSSLQVRTNRLRPIRRKTEKKQGWSMMDRYSAPEWFKRKENRRSNPRRIGSQR